MKDSKFIHPQKCNGSVLEETNSITISIDKYLTDELVSKIAAAQWHTDKPEWINKIKERISEEFTVFKALTKRIYGITEIYLLSLNGDVKE